MWGRPTNVLQTKDGSILLSDDYKGVVCRISYAKQESQKQAHFPFREGRRANDQMTPFVENLSNADLNDFAQYFSSQKLAVPKRQANAAIIAKGKEVIERNFCVVCHTATRVGQQHIARLAGQRKEYLLERLKAFKAFKRADYDGTMTSAAQGLTAEELTAEVLEPLAEYLSTLVSP